MTKREQLSSVGSALNELYNYVKGLADSITLASLVVLLREGYIAADFTTKHTINVRLSNGVVVKEVHIPLDLSSEEGLKDALRLYRALSSAPDKLDPFEKQFMTRLARALGLPLPKSTRRTRLHTTPKDSEGLILEVSL